MCTRLVAVVLLFFAVVPRAAATQVCSWLVETNKPDDVLMIDVWIEADADFDFVYQIGGKGLVDGSSKMHSPGSGTFALDKGKPHTLWGFGGTFEPPGTIDIAVELHKSMADLKASEKPTPLAKFVFHRRVPAGEKRSPATLAKKQCATVN